MNQPLAVLRASTVKFRKPARGSLHASARFLELTAEALAAELASRGRALAAVLVEVTDTAGTVTLTGQFDWFLQRSEQTLRDSGQGPGST